jgi:sugar/nucleoside kinase (ribokinase family)
VDVLCVSDQFRHGCVTEAVREKLTALARQGLPVVVDSRYSIGLFPGCILKPNELEAASAAGTQITRPDIEASAAVAQSLAQRAGSVVCMTLGGRGCLVAQPGARHHIPAVKLAPPLDICGAGDTFLAAFSCALAAGAGAADAAYIATMASAVTVKKIGQTGTASRGEILQQYNGRKP